ncbi:MAG: hypothetical protein L3J36_06985 [Rhodobacteraceae bacterium]|nr:hypothetical protein [Paracoccaceae bacterium]
MGGRNGEGQNELQQNVTIDKAWRNWLLMSVPSIAAILAAIYWLGFNTIFPLLAGLLVVTLLYQRFVNSRTWRSILLGVYALDN